MATEQIRRGSVWGAAALLAACGSSGGGADGGVGGPGGGPGGGPQDHPISVHQAGTTIPDQGSYFTPINAPGNTIPLFSEHPGEIMTIRNDSAAPVTLDAVTVEGEGNARPEEWRLETTDIQPTPLDAAGVELAPGGRLDFYPRFMPVEGTPRKAQVTIRYNGGETYAFALEGQGSPDATFFSHGTPGFERLMGQPGEDEQFGALIADASGKSWFSANHETANDAILVGHLDASGERVWARRFDGPFSDRQIDPGQNSETGGAARAIALGGEGGLYVTGAFASASSNNTFYVWTARVGAADGALAWSKLWSSADGISIARHSSTPYAIDATADDRVFVVGTTEGDAQVLLLAQSKADGAPIFARKIEIAAGSNDRGYTVKYAGGGVLYIGGQTAGNAGLLMKITGADGANPAVEWARRIGLGPGGGVNDLDVDAQGNVYTVLDVRGANTIFGFGSFDPSGALRWAKGYAGPSGDAHNAHTIRVSGDRVFVGGRTLQDGFDTQAGDGNLVVLNAADGAERFSAHYYTGKGNTDLAEHRIKGVALAGDKLILGVQVYTGTMNGVRYSGYWYDGLGEVTDFQGLAVDAAQATIAQVGDAVNETGFSKDVGEGTDPAASWTDASGVPFQPAADKHDGSPPDADLMFLSIDLTP